jgi:hypothetical protein
MSSEAIAPSISGTAGGAIEMHSAQERNSAGMIMFAVGSYFSTARGECRLASRTMRAVGMLAERLTARPFDARGCAVAVPAAALSAECSPRVNTRTHATEIAATRAPTKIVGFCTCTLATIQYHRFARVAVPRFCDVAGVQSAISLSRVRA